MAGTLQFCFKRYEKKYMLTPQQLVQITAGIQAHMRPEFGRARRHQGLYSSPTVKLLWLSESDKAL